MKEKRDRNWERVLETFKTGRYPNEGAYNSIPTIRWNLKVWGPAVWPLCECSSICMNCRQIREPKK